MRFLHNDVHAMNVMCAGDGTLLAFSIGATPAGVILRSNSPRFRLAGCRSCCKGMNGKRSPGS